MFRQLVSAALAGAVLAAAAPALAVTDAANDFLGTYTGPQGADLDILGASAYYDGTSFQLSATLAGAPGTTAGSLYVWGINRGAGTPRLTFGDPLVVGPSVGPTVLFDAVAVMFPDGLGRVATFSAPVTNLPGLVNIQGNTISASFAASLLPTTGFAAEDYTFTLWSRSRVNPAADGLRSEIADFAPNVGGFRAAVPEAGTWMLMIMGFGTVGGALRTRRRAPAARVFEF